MFNNLNYLEIKGEIWRTFVDEVMKEIIYSNCTDLDCQAVETPNVILMDVKYFEQIDELLNNTESSIIGMHNELKKIIHGLFILKFKITCFLQKII